jgi:hypothetical protein
MTNEMLTLTRANAIPGVHQGTIEAMPPDSSIDVIIFQLCDQPVRRQPGRVRRNTSLCDRTPSVATPSA